MIFDPENENLNYDDFRVKEFQDTVIITILVQTPMPLYFRFQSGPLKKAAETKTAGSLPTRIMILPPC